MFLSKRIRTFLLSVFITALCISFVSAQKAPDPALELPVVTKIDEISIKPLLKPDGKPLLVNFWATWCVPCVEEFPLLVQLHKDYEGRLDMITISLDNLAEIKRDVPKFLKSQNSKIPAYLLRSPDESAVISSLSPKYGGGLPFTILYSPTGETLYETQGIIKPEILKPIIERAIVVEECTPEDKATEN